MPPSLSISCARAAFPSATSSSAKPRFGHNDVLSSKGSLVAQVVRVVHSGHTQVDISASRRAAVLSLSTIVDALKRSA